MKRVLTKKKRIPKEPYFNNHVSKELTAILEAAKFRDKTEEELYWEAYYRGDDLQVDKPKKRKRAKRLKSANNR